MVSPTAPSTSRSAGRLFAVGLGVFVLTAGSVLLLGGEPVLRALGVEPMEHPWADARTISGAHVALERGLDPLVENPGDPWARPLNYPRIWLTFAHLGVRPEHTAWLAAGFAAVFALGALSLRRLASDRTTALLLLCGLFAPVTWFALERANNDLCVFGLCALAATAARPLFTVAGVVLATVLKLYPAAAVLGLLTPARAQSLNRLAPALLPIAAYLAWIGPDLGRIHGAAMSAPEYAYGITTLPLWLAKNTPLPLGFYLTAGALLLAASVLVAVRWRRLAPLDLTADPKQLTAFRVGAGVYLFSFTCGENFDYRLLFLLLTIPQLIAWSRSGPSRTRRGAMLTLAIVTLLQWSLCWRQPFVGGGLEQLALAVDEWLSWMLWIGLGVLTTLSLPGWVLARGGGVMIDETAGTTVAPGAQQTRRQQGA